jgi:long-chain acyl-CoA synthetase
MREGWLLTGDLGRIDADGRLTITGRRKNVIVLASGEHLHPDEIEAHYRQSRYIRELCVLGLTGSDSHRSERLHAVIVPDQDALRERRVVNTGELMRFEIEGLTALLPPQKRVLGYDLSMEPLPRTTTGELRRHEIARRHAEREQARRADERPLTADERAWLDDERHAAMVAAIAVRGRLGEQVTPDASLDLDLGLDSMDRVELISELEQRFGTRLDPAAAHEVLTVRHLVDALRPAGARDAAPGNVEAPWAALLRDLPPPSDPLLSGLLESRWLFAPFAYVVVQALRAVLPRVEVTGLEHLPVEGPCIICPNHQSYLDPFVIAALLPHRTVSQLFFVGATEYFSSPLMRRVARQINLVPVDPDENLVPAMKAGAFGLTHGKILMLFPEGERSIDGGVKRFKKGAPILAQHLGVPLLPVALRGIFEVWPRNHSLTWRLLAPWSTHRMRVAIGAPMMVPPGESSAEATARLRAAVAALWEAQQDAAPASAPARERTS